MSETEKKTATKWRPVCGKCGWKGKLQSAALAEQELNEHVLAEHDGVLAPGSGIVSFAA